MRCGVTEFLLIITFRKVITVSKLLSYSRTLSPYISVSPKPPLMKAFSSDSVGVTETRMTAVSTNCWTFNIHSKHQHRLIFVRCGIRAWYIPLSSLRMMINSCRWFPVQRERHTHNAIVSENLSHVVTERMIHITVEKILVVNRRLHFFSWPLLHRL